MPRGDRTGPEGFGPMTGRRMGYCSGYDSPGYTKGAPRGVAGFGFGRHLGRGMGFNRGFRFNRGYRYPEYYSAPTYSAQDETKFLENEIKALNEQMKAMQTRLSELKKEE